MKQSNSIITIPQQAKFSSVTKENSIFIADENVYNLYPKHFKKSNTIVIDAGEQFKNQHTVDTIIQQLIKLKANRQTTLVGIGGGVVTDITGYVASVFMRGINAGFVPTTLLALVDASIGGKNGVDVGVYKNIVGTIRQPEFILQDVSFLKTLPQNEWQNGFAEIIKHACIKDAAMFKKLQQNSISFYQKNIKELSLLIKENAAIKIKIVVKDVAEKGDRKLLNFGHTLGHALENQYQLSHGEAISIGMMFACKLSEGLLGFTQTQQVVEMLQQYGLPTNFKFDTQNTFNILTMDKKRTRNNIHFILLEKIGKAKIVEIGLNDLNKMLAAFTNS